MENIKIATICWEKEQFLNASILLWSVEVCVWKRIIKNNSEGMNNWLENDNYSNNNRNTNKSEKIDAESDLWGWAPCGAWKKPPSIGGTFVMLTLFWARTPITNTLSWRGARLWLGLTQRDKRVIGNPVATKSPQCEPESTSELRCVRLRSHWLRPKNEPS